MSHEYLQSHIIGSDIPYENLFSVAGTVVHKYRPADRDFVILTIATSGGILADGQAPKTNHPKVIFYRDLAEKVDQDIIVEDRKGPRVCITGMVQTAIKKTDENTVYQQSLVGNMISFAPTQLQLISNKNIGSLLINDENKVIITGVVQRLYTFSDRSKTKDLGTIVTLRTFDAHANFPKITCFRHLHEKAKLLKEGDIICAVGCIHTSKSVKDESVRYFENIVVGDFDVLKS